MLNCRWIFLYSCRSISPGPMQIGRRAWWMHLSSFPRTTYVTSARICAVTHVTHIRHIHVFSHLFADNKSHFNVAFWALALRTSSEEHRWMNFAGIFWSHVIVLEAQTAPWVTFFYFLKKDSSPVATQQPAAARESVDGNSFPVFFRQLKPGCRPIEAHPEVLFTFSIFVIIRWIWFTLQWRKRTTRKISEWSQTCKWSIKALDPSIQAINK